MSPIPMETISSSSVKPRVFCSARRMSPLLLVISRNVFINRVNLGHGLIGGCIGDRNRNLTQSLNRVAAAVEQRRDGHLPRVIGQRQDNVVGRAQNAVGARVGQTLDAAVRAGGPRSGQAGTVVGGVENAIRTGA